MKNYAIFSWISTFGIKTVRFIMAYQADIKVSSNSKTEKNIARWQFFFFTFKCPMKDAHW